MFNSVPIARIVCPMLKFRTGEAGPGHFFLIKKMTRERKRKVKVELHFWRHRASKRGGEVLDTLYMQNQALLLVLVISKTETSLRVLCIKIFIITMIRHRWK